ncbi:hypothetical protein ACFTRE_15505 [Bacillus subtilis]|uniref:hypothetical protein n=1 Tax=Bacillus sp. PS237 TaxID=2954723 RepID=UPI002E202BE1|nr:hypothetical protein [Bacillus subtilis]
MNFVDGVAKESINSNGITGNLTVTVSIAFAAASMVFSPTSISNIQSIQKNSTSIDIIENSKGLNTFNQVSSEFRIPITVNQVRQENLSETQVISQTINAQTGDSFGIISKEIVAKEEPTVLDKLISKRDKAEKSFSLFGYISSALILTPSIFGGIHWAVTIPPALIILSLPISIKLRQKMREVINDS